MNSRPLYPSAEPKARTTLAAGCGVARSASAASSATKSAAAAPKHVERAAEALGREGAEDEPGLCTSTGVVESGGKTAIGTLGARSGMHWTVAGALAIIALRCRKLNGRFEDFWARWAQRRVAA